MKRHPDVPLWVSVGDVASNDGEYFTPIAPLYWIKGNNEDFDVIARGDRGRSRPRRRCTTCRTAGRIRSDRGASPRSAARSRRAGITRRRRAAAVARAQAPRRPSLKLGKSRDDKRRHFVRDEVLAVQGAHEHRAVSDARGAASVLSGGPPHRRGQDRAQRRARVDAAAAAPVRPSPRVHRFDPPGRPLDRPRRRHEVVSADRRRDVQGERLDTNGIW